MAVWREKYKTEKSEINMNLIKIQQIIKIKVGEKTNFLDDFFKLTFFLKKGMNSIIDCTMVLIRSWQSTEVWPRSI